MIAICHMQRSVITDASKNVALLWHRHPKCAVEARRIALRDPGESQPGKLKSEVPVATAAYYIMEQLGGT